MEAQELTYSTFYGVPAGLLEDAWSAVWPLVDKTLEKSKANRFYNEYDIYSAIQRRDMQLWVAVKETKIVAVLITQIVVYPRTKLFDIIFVGGEDIDSWLSVAWDEMVAFAQSHKCSVIRGIGRAGWGKKLDPKFNKTALWEYEI